MAQRKHERLCSSTLTSRLGTATEDVLADHFCEGLGCLFSFLDVVLFLLLLLLHELPCVSHKLVLCTLHQRGVVANNQDLRWLPGVFDGVDSIQLLPSNDLLFQGAVRDDIGRRQGLPCQRTGVIATVKPLEKSLLLEAVTILGHDGVVHDIMGQGADKVARGHDGLLVGDHG